MGYRADAPLTALVPDVEDFGVEEIAERVRGRLLDEVQRRTPVADLPPAYEAVPDAGGMAGFIRDRKGRAPGTLKASWREGKLEQHGGRYSVEVYTDDPVALFVEYDTRPHLIRARHRTRSGGPGYLRFPMGLTFLYRHEVHHPGTQGVHMMRDSLATIEIVWPEIADEVIAERALVR